MVSRLMLMVAAMLFCSLAAAADGPHGMFGDWAVGATDDGTAVYAGTLNDSGEVFGEYCFFKAKSCRWMIGMHTSCKPGASARVLLGSDSNAAPLDVYCFGELQGGLYSYAFKDWKTLEEAIKDASRLGFAVPTSGDRFVVVGFSLNGRIDAQQAAEGFFSNQLSGPMDDAPAGEAQQGTTHQRL